MVGTSSDMFIAGLNNGIFVTRILNGGSQASFFSSVGLYLPGHNMGLGYSLNDGTSAIVYVGSRNGGVVRAFDASASCSKILESRMILSLASSQIAEFLDGNSILITTQLTSIFAVMRKSDLVLTSN